MHGLKLLAEFHLVIDGDLGHPREKARLTKPVKQFAWTQVAEKISRLVNKHCPKKCKQNLCLLVRTTYVTRRCHQKMSHQSQIKETNGSPTSLPLLSSFYIMIFHHSLIVSKFKSSPTAQDWQVFRMTSHFWEYSYHRKLILAWLAWCQDICNQEACKKLNKSVLLNLYYSFAYRYFIYCNHVWGNTYPTNLNKMIVLQKKKLIRIVTCSPYRAHSKPLLVANVLSMKLTCTSWVYSCITIGMIIYQICLMASFRESMKFMIEIQGSQMNFMLN